MTEILELIGTDQLSPSGLDQVPRTRCDRLYCLSPFGEYDQRGASIAGVGAPLEIAGPLELFDRLRHGLFADASMAGEFTNLDTLRRDERKHLRIPRSDVAEAGFSEGRLDAKGVFPMQQAQERARLPAPLHA